MANGILLAGAMIFGLLVSSQTGYAQTAQQTTVNVDLGNVAEKLTAKMEHNQTAPSTQARPTTDKKQKVQTRFSYEVVLACMEASGVAEKGKNGALVVAAPKSLSTSHASIRLSDKGMFPYSEKPAPGADDNNPLPWTPLMEQHFVQLIRDHYRYTKKDAAAKATVKSAAAAMRPVTAKENENLKRLELKVRDMNSDAEVGGNEFQTKKASAMKAFYESLFNYEKNRLNGRSQPQAATPAKTDNRFNQLENGFASCEKMLEGRNSRKAKTTARKATPKLEIANKPVPANSIR